MKTQLVTITPKMAADWLENCNVNNRRIRHHWVKALAEMISKGHFKLTHQGIAFDTDGFLADGQHRLMAIALANKPVQMLVSQGLPPEAFPYHDNMLGKTASDRLRLDRNVVEPCSFLARFYANDNISDVADLQAFIDRFGPALESIHQHCNKKVANLSSSAVRAAASLRFDESQDYVLGSYRALIMMDFQNMSPIVQAFFRQVANNKMSNQEKFLRAFHVFGVENSEKTYLGFKNISANYTAIRDHMERLLNV